MYGFKNFLIEQLRSNSLVPDSGFNDVSEINHEGQKYHAVVNYVHKGQGHYKIVARVGKVKEGQALGNVGFRQLKAPETVKIQLASAIGRSVSKFKNSKDWNSLEFGGVDARTRQTYIKHVQHLVALDPENLEGTYGTRAHHAAAILTKKKKIEQPTLSGQGGDSPYMGYERSGKSDSGGSSFASVDSMYGGKFAPSGKFAQSGWKKKKTIDTEAKAGLWGGSSAISAKQK